MNSRVNAESKSKTKQNNNEFEELQRSNKVLSQKVLFLIIIF
jgi:hypothetical protein